MLEIPRHYSRNFLCRLHGIRFLPSLLLLQQHVPVHLHHMLLPIHGSKRYGSARPAHQHHAKAKPRAECRDVTMCNTRGLRAE